MRYSGVILLAFIVYHLAHYTVKVDATLPDYAHETTLEGIEGAHGLTSRTLWGVYDKLSAHGAIAPGDMQPVHNVYGMVAAGFSSPLASGFYILAMFLLCFHLSHGISSMFQSLGLRNATWRKHLGKIALVIAVIVFIGFASLPTAGLLGAFDCAASSASEAASTLSH